VPGGGTRAAGAGGRGGAAAPGGRGCRGWCPGPGGGRGDLRRDRAPGRQPRLDAPVPPVHRLPDPAVRRDRGRLPAPLGSLVDTPTAGLRARGGRAASVLPPAPDLRDLDTGLTCALAPNLVSRARA